MDGIPIYQGLKRYLSFFIIKLIYRRMKRDELMFLSLLIFGIITLGFFVVLDYVKGYKVSSYLELVHFSLLFALLLLWLKGNPKLRRALPHIATVIGLSLFGSLVITGGGDGAGIIWFSLYPPIVFYILPKKEYAIWWTILGLLYLGFLLLVEIDLLKLPFMIYYNDSGLMQLLSAYLLISFLTVLNFSLIDGYMRLFENLFYNSPYGIMVWNRPLKEALVNPALERILSDVGIRDCKEFLREALRNCLRDSEDIDAIFSSECVSTTSKVMLSKEVTIRGFYYRILLFKASEDFYTFIIEDMTEKRRREEEIRRIRKQLEEVDLIEYHFAKVATIFHDLKNYLSPLLLLIQELQRAVYSGEGLSLEEIKDMLSLASASMEKIEKQIFSITLIKRIDVQRSLIDLKELLRDAVRITEENLRSYLKSFNLSEKELPIELRLNLPDTSDPILIRGDRDGLLSAILNLLQNSVEAIAERFLNEPEGSDYKGMILINLSYPSQDELEAIMSDFSENRRYIRVDIVDNGIGLENFSEALKLFSSTKKTGTGMGLSTAAVIIKSHHGILLMEGKRNKGTTAKIYLPLASDIDTNLAEG